MQARVVIEVVTTLIWLPLELMVIAALLRGQYRRFPLVLAFVVAEFFAVAAEIPAYWAFYQGVKPGKSPRLWIWSFDEVLLQFLIYAVVIGLIYQAASRLQSRRAVAGFVILGAIVFAGGSFLIHFDGAAASIGTWLTPWMRDLNLSSAVLDLGLWTLLISSRKKDPTLLLMSGGLGIRFTGEAIGDSLRQLAISKQSKPLSLSGAIVVAVVDILCLFIWWRALRQKAVAPGASQRSVAASKKTMGSPGATPGSPSETGSSIS